MDLKNHKYHNHFNQPIIFTNTENHQEIIDNLSPGFTALALDINSNLVLVNDSGTVSNIITSNDVVIDVTRTELEVLVTNLGLIVGNLYRVSNVDIGLYGGSTIIVRAIEVNRIVEDGYGIFENPQYDTYSIWNVLATYIIGDIVIWGGKQWTNVNGLVGTSIDEYTLDSEWVVMSFGSGYNYSYDKIKYKYTENRIFYREDNYVNKVSLDLTERYNTIKNFQWGRGSISDNSIEGGYVNIINIEGDFFRNTFKYSYFYENNNIDFFNNTATVCSIYNNTNTFIRNNKITNSINNNINCDISGNENGVIRNNTNCAINGNSGGGGYINNNNDINIYNNQLKDYNSSINNNSGSGYIFNNIIYGHIKLNIFYNSSHISGNIIDNLYFQIPSGTGGGEIFGNTLDNSFIINNRLIGRSLIKNNSLLDSNINNCVLNASSFLFDIGGVINTKSINDVKSNGLISTFDLSTSTIIFGNYTKEIYIRPDGTPRLRYYNDSDVLTIVNVNA